MAGSKAALLLATALWSTLTGAQRAGTSIPEHHPKLTTSKCTLKGGCHTQNTAVVIDQLSRNTHLEGHTDISCGTWDGLNTTLCPDAKTCFKNCVMEGVNYTAHGVTTKGDSLTLNMFMPGADGTPSSVSPRVYLLDEGETKYANLKLLNRELAYDADVSKLVCGMNGALYLSEMDMSGGKGPLNTAGAAYGTGYCDAQCFSIPWINGVANINATHGACCNEMDIWEANALAAAYTPHACNVTGLYECTGDLCGSAGVCDKNGCSFNPYLNGAKSFYGRGLEVDTNRVFTVVTQFVTTDGTDKGTLKEIRRKYVQDGKVIQNAVINVGGVGNVSSVTDALCSVTASKFEQQGGLTEMGDALARGMVLIFSIWDDTGGFMNWLDASNSWGDAGPCNATEGNPAIIAANYPGTAVTFSNIKWGEIGSTSKCK